MELKYKAIACFLIGIFSLSGCTSTFDDLNTNPDTTTKVNASMLASKVILDMTKSASNWRNEFLVKRMFWGEQIDDRQYNRFGKGSFDNIQTLRFILFSERLVFLSYNDGYGRYPLFGSSEHRRTSLSPI